MKDDKLLSIIHTDPERGMRLVMEMYAALVYAVIKSRLTASVFCSDDIESCVADTFSEFYCDLDKYTPALGSIKSWLCSIAKHNALDHLRRHYKHAGTVSLEDRSVEAYADDFSLEGSFEDKTERMELVRAVKKLGMPDREILIRKFFLAQSSKEIAAIMRMSVSNIDTRTHRAIQKLRRQLGGDEP